MNHFVTQALFDKAVDMVTPSIEAFLQSEHSGGRRSFYLVVDLPSGETFETSFGDPKESWKSPFDEIARAKADLCRRTGQPSGAILSRMPWLLERGDTRYAGGVVEDGLVVAGSGQKGHVDEMFAWWAFNAIACLCTDAVENIPATAPHFLG